MAENNFWRDLDEAAAGLVRDTLLGERIEKAAQQIDRSPDLLYKASNPTTTQQLNIKQWLAILKFTGNFAAVKALAEACGFAVVRRNGSLAQVLRELAEDLEHHQEVGGSKPRPAAQYRFPREREA